MSRLFIRPPNRASESARALARELGCRMIRRTNSRYRAREGDVIINWGNPVHTIGGRFKYLNDPTEVYTAIDKRASWLMLQEACVPTVEFTEDPQTARHWLEPDGIRLLVRTSLRSSQGRGIIAYSYEGTKWTKDYRSFCAAQVTPAYVKVFGRDPRTVTEYRVHVVGGQVIDYQQKMRRRNHEGGCNPYIRSSRNGWVFAREDAVLPSAANTAAIEATLALGLDFGAVDVGVCTDGRVCVYEVNTAPGLEGSTLGAYARGLSELVELCGASSRLQEGE